MLPAPNHIRHGPEIGQARVTEQNEGVLAGQALTGGDLLLYTGYPGGCRVRSLKRPGRGGRFHTSERAPEATLAGGFWSRGTRHGIS